MLTIDNVEFKLNKWAPFWISGLEVGEHKISIDLKDKNGKTVKGIMPKQQTSIFKLKEVDFFVE